MAKERLSKLQKWILTEAYKKGKREYKELDVGKTWKLIKKYGYFICKVEIGRDYYGIESDWWGRTAFPKTKHVILARSIGKLEFRGYVKRNYWYSYQVPDDCQTRDGRFTMYGIFLTELGIKKAKELLKV